jgi:hypothetical protein
MWKKILIGVGIGLVVLVVVVGAGFRILMMGRGVFGWFGSTSPRGLAQNVPYSAESPWGQMMRGWDDNEYNRIGPGMMNRDFGPGGRMMQGRDGKQGFGPRGQQFDQQDLTTQDATVKQVDENLVLLEMSDGTSYAIQHQALWSIQDAGFVMKAGDTLKVTGFNVKMDDTHTAYHIVKLEDSIGKTVEMPGMYGRP